MLDFAHKWKLLGQERKYRANDQPPVTKIYCTVLVGSNYWIKITLKARFRAHNVDPKNNSEIGTIEKLSNEMKPFKFFFKKKRKSERMLIG